MVSLVCHWCLVWDKEMLVHGSLWKFTYLKQHKSSLFLSYCTLFFLCFYSCLMHITFLSSLCFLFSLTIDCNIYYHQAFVYVIDKCHCSTLHGRCLINIFKYVKRNFLFSYPNKKVNEIEKKVTNAIRILIFGVLLCYFGHILVYAL